MLFLEYYPQPVAGATGRRRRGHSSASGCAARGSRHARPRPVAPAGRTEQRDYRMLPCAPCFQKQRTAGRQMHTTYQPFAGPVAGMLSASTTPPRPEATLLQRLQAREGQALTDFESQYGKELQALIRALVPDARMAQDVWQECLLHLWQAFPQYDASRGRFVAWARRICQNVAIDELLAVRWRDLQCTQSLELTTEVYARPVTGGFQPDNLGILDLCQQLRPQQQQVISLLYGQDLTFEQTAQHLDLPVSTVKTRAQAAYRALRRFVA